MAGMNKRDLIRSALDPEPDLDLLRELATSNQGLLDDNVRQRVWPLFLNCHQDASDGQSRSVWEELPVHRDEDQVKLDVSRAFNFYPKGFDQGDKQLRQHHQDLSDCISYVLRTNPALSYFQGFHDVAQVCLLVLGPERAPDTLTALTLLKLRDFMLPSLEPSLQHLRLIPAILLAIDQELHYHLQDVEPFFALSATLTLHAHDLETFSEVTRLYDFLLAQPSVAAIYLIACVLQYRRQELLVIPRTDLDILHSVLSKPPSPFPLEEIIQDTHTTMLKYPPKSIPGKAWQQLSSYSVLKTSWPSVRDQGPSEGTYFLNKHVTQLNRKERQQRIFKKIWAYRRPGAILLLAIVVYQARQLRLDELVWSWLRSFAGPASE